MFYLQTLAHWIEIIANAITVLDVFYPLPQTPLFNYVPTLKANMS